MQDKKSPKKNLRPVILPVAMDICPSKVDCSFASTRIILPKFVPVKIPIFKFEGKLTPEYSRKITAFLTGCLFSESIPSENEADLRYVSMYLSLGVFINEQFTLRIPTSLESYNMVCENFDLNEKSLDSLLAINSEYQKLYEKFCLDKNKKSYAVTIIFVSLAFIFMGRKISVQTNENYFYSRYNAIGSETENPGVSEILKRAGLRPVNTYCERAYTTISGLFRVRKSLFLNIVTAATNKSSMWTEPLKIVLKYLAFSEMSHIELINKYLLDQNPELLTIKCLSYYRKYLLKALEYISSIDENERPFIKLLYNTEQTRFLNRNLFDSLIVAARTVEAFGQKKSFEYYTGELNPKYAHQLIDIINSYLFSKQIEDIKL